MAIAMQMMVMMSCCTLLGLFFLYARVPASNQHVSDVVMASLCNLGCLDARIFTFYFFYCVTLVCTIGSSKSMTLLPRRRLRYGWAFTAVWDYRLLDLRSLKYTFTSLSTVSVETLLIFPSVYTKTPYRLTPMQGQEEKRKKAEEEKKKAAEARKKARHLQGCGLEVVPACAHAFCLVRWVSTDIAQDPVAEYLMCVGVCAYVVCRTYMHTYVRTRNDMCVWTYVCIHVYIYIYMHVDVDVDVDVCVYVSVYVCVYVYVYSMSMSVSMSMSMYMYMYMYMCVCSLILCRPKETV